jgi:CMP/dCMP kinase
MIPLQIAIDGPVGAGKSDISARLAQELGLVYLYTGAMYRALALACFRNGIGYKDAPRVRPLLEKYRIDLTESDPKSGKAFKVLLNGEDVTQELFQPEIDKGSSAVSTIPEVRRFMVKRQQDMASNQRVVMEGRDIGLRVLPGATLKIFLTATLEERARRRHELQQAKGLRKSYAEVLQDTRDRDLQDSTRQADPLTKTSDAWELDTTGMTREQVVERIINELKIRHLI